MLTVRPSAGDRPATTSSSWSPSGRWASFTRQLFLGDTLDTDRLEAGYEAGVLTLRIPVAERAKPRRVAVNVTNDHKTIEA